MSTLPSDLHVSAVCLPLDRVPVLSPTTILKTALEEMVQRRLGIVCIVHDDMSLAGIFTDGDIRRQLLTMQKPFSAFFGDDIIDHAIRNPSTIASDAPLSEAIDLMERKQIWDLPVLGKDAKLVGLLHLNPVVQALIGRKG